MQVREMSRKVFDQVAKWFGMSQEVSD